MPKTITENNQTHYLCQDCGFKYEEKEWAEKCEAWCREHKSCNIEVVKHAVQTRKKDSEKN